MRLALLLLLIPFCGAGQAYLDVYNDACANSLNGNAEKATQLLRRAFELGYNDFEWMYYDKDLDPIRNHPAYIDLEKRYHPDSVVYFFDILQRLQQSDDVKISDRIVSMDEGTISTYTFDEIRSRIGGDVDLAPGDNLLDFSGRQLKFLRCRFRNEGGAYNVISHISIGLLSATNCSGNLKLFDFHTKDLMLYEMTSGANQLRNIMFDDVTVEGAMNLTANGFQFFCRNSVFNTTPDEGDVVALVWHLAYERMSITNSVFSTKGKNVDPFEINIMDSKRVEIGNTEFNHPMRLHGAITDELTVTGSKFPAQVDLINLQLPDFNTYFPFSQLNDTKLVRIDYDEYDNTVVHGDSTEDYSDTVLFDELTGLYKRLYDSYRSRADISSANSAYVRMKDIEITHLKTIEKRTFEETLRLRLNQLMGFYTDHATSPGKALIISFYIILAFGIFYCFFPSDWDQTSKSKVIADFRLFIEKNEHGYVKPFFKMMRGLSMSLLNAVTLSLNAFITLGFGNIPTSGIARYICVVQGALGWFLLSLFTVALLNQVLL